MIAPRPPRRFSPSFWPLLALGLYLAVESVLTALGHPAPCLFRLVTGLPCPTCGSTRAALRLLRLDLWGAAAYNPLLVLSLFGFVAVGARGLLRWRRGEQPFPPLRRPGLVTLALVLALLINWVYVIKAEQARARPERGKPVRRESSPAARAAAWRGLWIQEKLDEQSPPSALAGRLPTGPG